MKEKKSKKKERSNFFRERETDTQGGYVSLMLLVFCTIFLILGGGLLQSLVLENRLKDQKENSAEAFTIAEAGLEYYRWHLAHFPTDMQDGTATSGPYVHEYDDPEGDTIGKFSLSVDGKEECDQISSVEITSTGWTFEDPNITRTVYGKYARPSVAEYAIIINTGVWWGPSEEVSGPAHSNSGVRMDGTNHSILTSAVSDWYCPTTFGCSPPGTRDGIFGIGSNDHLWKFPAPQIDFTGITLDLVDMKTRAQSLGLYFPGISSAEGYHTVFQSDGSFDLYQVDSTDSYTAYDVRTNTSHAFNNTISSETFLGSYNPPSGCALLFFEDKLWIDGTVSGKITLASADIADPTLETDIILNDSVEYTTLDGTDGLTAVAEGSVFIPLFVPNDMVVDGIYIAQNGSFIRNHYEKKNLPPAADPYVMRNSFTMHGTVVSNSIWTVAWVNGGGTTISGFPSSSMSYDLDLAEDPPPLTPYTSDEYEFIEWHEIE